MSLSSTSLRFPNIQDSDGPEEMFLGGEDKIWTTVCKGNFFLPILSLIPLCCFKCTSCEIIEFHPMTLDDFICCIPSYPQIFLIIMLAIFP